MNGAASARKTITARRPRPSRARRLSANSVAKRRHGDSAAATAGAGAGAAAATRMGSVRRGRPAEAHPRIEQRVDDVHHEVDRDEDRNGDEEVGHDDWTVELGDRIDEQLAAAGPREDRFRDEREGD